MQDWEIMAIMITTYTLACHTKYPLLDQHSLPVLDDAMHRGLPAPRQSSGGEIPPYSPTRPPWRPGLARP